MHEVEAIERVGSSKTALVQIARCCHSNPVSRKVQFSRPSARKTYRPHEDSDFFEFISKFVANLP